MYLNDVDFLNSSNIVYVADSVPTLTQHWLGLPRIEHAEGLFIIVFFLQSRNVYHFHFPVWPEHGVLEEPGVLLEFIDNVNGRQRMVGKKKPPLIHSR